MPPMLALALVALQDASPPSHTTVVTAPRSDAPATSTSLGHVVVTGEELARTGERSLPRAIGRASGVWIQETNLGGGSPFIRGLTGNQVLLIVDGVRVNDSTTRFGPNQSLNTIDPLIVERVEVLRGPASVLYGSDAIGGVVLIWTKSRRPGARGGPLGVAADVDLVGDSATEGGRGAIGLSHASDDFGTLFIGGGQVWNDLRTGGGSEVPFTGFNGNSLFGSEEIALDDEHTLRATARVDRTFNVPRTDKMIVGFGQTQPSSQRFLFALQDRRAYGVTYDDAASNPVYDHMQVRFSYNTYEERRDRIKNSTPPSTTNRLEQDEVTTISLGADWKRALGESQLLTWGLDVYRDQVDSTRTDVDLTTGSGTIKDGQFAPDARYTSVGVFLQDEILAFDPVDVTAGLRYSYFDFGFDPFGGGPRESGTFDALTGSLQVAGNVTEQNRLSASVAQGFRAPNLDDLAKNGSFGGGTELANPNLDPEKSLTAELAWELSRESTRFGLAGWWTDISDLITRRLVDPGGPGAGDETFLRDNAGSATLFGVDGRLDQRLGGADSPFGLDAVVSYTFGQQFDDAVDPNTGKKPLDDVPFRRIPPVHGQVGLTWDSPAERFLDAIGWARVETVFAGPQDRLHPQDVSDPRIDPSGTGGWWIVNLDVGGPFGEAQRGSSWSVGLHNLFDQSYRVHGSGFDAPGIALVATLSLSF